MMTAHQQLNQYLAIKIFGSLWPQEALVPTAYFIDNAFNLTEKTND